MKRILLATAIIIASSMGLVACSNDKGSIEWPRFDGEGAHTKGKVKIAGQYWERECDWSLGEGSVIQHCVFRRSES